MHARANLQRMVDLLEVAVDTRPVDYPDHPAKRELGIRKHPHHG